jgi:hypothetical protein
MDIMHEMCSGWKNWAERSPTVWSRGPTDAKLGGRREEAAVLMKRQMKPEHMLISNDVKHEL